MPIDKSISLDTKKIKPIELPEYIKWVNNYLTEDITERSQHHYESVSLIMKSQFEQSSFWTNLIDSLEAHNYEYQAKFGYPLLQNVDEKPEIVIKPWKSFIEKTLRYNVINNDHWPEEPTDGWILPSNWFIRINDIIRTTIIVKYLDGVHFIVDKMRSTCKTNGSDYHCDFEATEEGYYAAHIYKLENIEIPKTDWDTEIIPVQFEIQVNTQIQDVIKKLTHKYYEERRLKIPAESEYGWQWNYTSEEFAPNYLGHILHYVEGMIMEIRNRR